MGQKQLLFDENLGTSPKTLSGQLYRLLEKRGWKCHSVHDFPGLPGKPDEEIIAFAKEQGYALLTMDKRAAYLALKHDVDIYLILHEKHVGEKGETEEYTVVHLEPFASVQAQTSFHAQLSTEDEP